MDIHILMLLARDLRVSKKIKRYLCLFYKSSGRKDIFIAKKIKILRDEKLFCSPRKIYYLCCKDNCLITK